MNRAGGSDPEQRTESLLTAQIHALERIAAGAPLREILAVLALAIEEQAGGESIVSIFLVDAAGKRLRVGAAPSLPEDFNRAVDGIEIKHRPRHLRGRRGTRRGHDHARYRGRGRLARASRTCRKDKGSRPPGRCRSCPRRARCSARSALTSASGASRRARDARSSKCCAGPRASRSSGVRPRTPRNAAVTDGARGQQRTESASGTARCRSTS